MFFPEEIIKWYQINKRELPWRAYKDPYIIWLSEIILQQTRVEQGLPYYYNILERFPTVQDMALASEQEIMKLWEGLGYYSRARNMHSTARYVSEVLQGVFPTTYIDLLKLKGIGPYTAAAIASFAYGEQQAVLDGNVFRLLARFFGISLPINSTEGKKAFEKLAGETLYKKDPATYNQAIMEFGALQCKPVSPDCENCPLQAKCIAYQSRSVDLLPVKNKAAKPTPRYFNYLIIEHEGSFFINQRLANDIWQNLYEFPLIESQESLSEKTLQETPEWKALSANQNYKIISVSKEYKHILSHRIIYAQFWKVEKIGYKNFSDENWFLVNENNVSNYAFPRLIHQYLENNSLL